MLNLSNLLKIIFLLSLTFSVQKGFSQVSDPVIGIKGGLNLSNLYVDEIKDQNPRFGYHFGLYGKMPVNDFFALQPELLLTTKGTTTRYSGGLFNFDGELSINTSYLDLPVPAVSDLSEYFKYSG